jgi:RecB family endonuclease NucS
MGWEFISEAALEQFVWQNLAEALGFTPLRQQYRLKDEICDRLALDREGGLVLLALKYAEDRYLMPQSTRYDDSLLEESSGL